MRNVHTLADKQIEELAVNISDTLDFVGKVLVVVYTRDAFDNACFAGSTVCTSLCALEHLSENHKDDDCDNKEYHNVEYCVENWVFACELVVVNKTGKVFKGDTAAVSFEELFKDNLSECLCKTEKEIGRNSCHSHHDRTEDILCEHADDELTECHKVICRHEETEETGCCEDCCVEDSESLFLESFFVVTEHRKLTYAGNHIDDDVRENR